MIPDKTIDNLPESPGVYIFKDSADNIIYVGKAKNLRERVKSYARDGLKDPKTIQLINSIEGLDFLITMNEKEAFLLENNLIKEHTPKYNINLKDDKTYISLKVTVNDRFPGLFITRKIRPDGAIYFGPYPHAKEVRDVIRLIQSIYPVRRCRDSAFKKRKRPCILYDMGRCNGPCIPGADEDSYRRLIDELIEVLSGRAEGLLKRLETDIEKLSSEWRFTEAGKLKTRYLAIKAMIERQHVHEHMGKDRDCWAFLDSEKGIDMVLLTFSKGVLLSKRLFKNSLIKVGYMEAISSFLFQYYSKMPVPDEIILSEMIEDSPFLEEYLKERRGPKVKIIGPDRREARALIRLAIENLHKDEPYRPGIAFKERFRLRQVPNRIEVYDCSHISGTNPVGVMVVFEDFKAVKAGYRVFNIRDASPMDDVAAMTEVMNRRLKDSGLGPIPDLFVIDGGKGQLAAVVKALKAQRIERDVIAIAKGERRRAMEDILYLPNRKNPIVLPKTSPLLKEIVKMRDEAHRFAVASHRSRRKREDLY